MSAITDLKEKISKIDEDIQKLRSLDSSDKKIEMILQYKEYLQDELKILQQNSKQS